MSCCSVTEAGADLLTCGSCQKVFTLANIVEFIQHKSEVHRIQVSLDSTIQSEGESGGDSANETTASCVNGDDVADPNRKISEASQSLEINGTLKEELKGCDEESDKGMLDVSVSLKEEPLITSFKEENENLPVIVDRMIENESRSKTLDTMEISATVSSPGKLLSFNFHYFINCWITLARFIDWA